MSRRAKFGRTGTVQASLASTLVSIAREMQNAEDSNIMDAWKNGGEWHGKAVTDDMVSAYWRDRIKNLDPKDPAYDQIKDQQMQLQYGIEQSKQDLAYVQGKQSAASYAQFYLKWAGKVPKNSEFWRTLQKDAAQLLERAKTDGANASNKRKTDAFNAFVTDQTNGNLAVGNALSDALTALSKETGLSITDNGDQLLTMLGTDYASNPAKYRALRDAITASPDGFNGVFTHAWVAGQFSQATQGYDAIATRAKADGYASAYSSASKSEGDMASWGQNLQVWSVAKSYDQAYSAYSKVVDDPNASISDKQNARNKFSATVMGLSKTPGIDLGSAGALVADANRAIGVDAGDAPSFGQSLATGHGGVTTQDQAVAANDMALTDAMAANPGAYVYAPVDAHGQFDASGAGAVGIVAAGSLPAGHEMVPVPGLDGKATMVAVMPHSVKYQDPNDPNAAPQEIGKVITYNIGGRTVNLYGYQDSTGAAHWSQTAPWADGVTSAPDKNGDTILTPPASGSTDPLTRAQQLDSKYGTHIADTLTQKDASGNSIVDLAGTTSEKVRQSDGSFVTVKYANGSFSATQSQSTLDQATGSVVETSSVPINLEATFGGTPTGVIAPSRLAAGEIAGVTFSSPTGAATAAAGSAMSQSQMATLAQDPTFQANFVAQAMATFNTQDPADPRIADAWTQVTSAASGTAERNAQAQRAKMLNAAERIDLKYPAQPAQNPAFKAVTVNFGGQAISLPKVPDYLTQGQAQAGLNATGSDLSAQAKFLTQFGGKPVPGVVGAMGPAVPAGPTIRTTTQGPTQLPGGGIMGPASLPPTLPGGMVAPPPAPKPLTSPSTGQRPV